MVVVTALVASSIGTMAAAFVWGWRTGTLGETVQERYDREFERITRRLHPPA